MVALNEKKILLKYIDLRIPIPVIMKLFIPSGFGLYNMMSKIIQLFVKIKFN